MTDKEYKAKYQRSWRNDHKYQYNEYIRRYREKAHKRSVSSLITEEDFIAFKKIADDLGTTPSGLIRELIKEAIAHG